jgi:hypothetical protein
MKKAKTEAEVKEKKANAFARKASALKEDGGEGETG